MTTEPSRRRLRACAVGSWTLVLTGVVHTAAELAAAVAPTPDAHRAARDAMSATVVAIGGVERTFAELMTGLSLTMAVFLTAFGALNLLALRRAPSLYAADAVLLLDLAAAAVALALAVALLPPPPVVLLGGCCAAFAYALSRRPALPTAPA